jgi:hypothetical protein
MKGTYFFAFAAALALAGCGSVPMTAVEFRDGIKKSSLGKVETFEVKRPVAEVGRTFQRKATECLNFELTSTQKPTIGFGSATRVYAIAKTTVLASANKAELHFQVKSVGNVAPEPPDGNFYLVADALPVGKNGTRVEIHRGAAVAVAEALRSWANGDERGCPDPMRTFDR